MEQFSESTAKFAALLQEQVERVAKMKETKDFIDYSKLDKIVIGVCGGDGHWAVHHGAMPSIF